MLYELISGHPPYYPEITRERVLHEPVPPLLPRGAVPSGVRELALRLLSKSEAERPANATILRPKLAVAAADVAGSLAPLVHAAPADAAAGSRGGRWLPLALGEAAIVAVAVIFMMPAGTPPDKAAVVEKVRLEAEQEGLAKRTAIDERAAREAARAKSEAARDRFNASFKSLDARAASRWSTAAFALARDRQCGNLRYNSAAQNRMGRCQSG